MGEWTEAEDALLRSLLSQGLSRREIAARIEGRSRNSVIGRCGRLGLSDKKVSGIVKARREKPASPTRAADPIPFPVKPKPAARPKPSPAPKPERPPAPAAAAIPEPLPNPTPILEAKLNQCRWINDERPHGGSMCCGAPVEPGTSWCATHAKRVYVSGAEQRRHAARVRAGREKAIIEAVASGKPIREVAERYRRTVEQVIEIMRRAA